MPSCSSRVVSSIVRRSQHQLWGHLEVKVTSRCARASYAVAHKEGSKQRSSLDPTQRTNGRARAARGDYSHHTPHSTPPEGLAARGRAVGRDVRRRVPARAARADVVLVQAGLGRARGRRARPLRPPQRPRAAHVDRPDVRVVSLSLSLSLIPMLVLILRLSISCSCSCSFSISCSFSFSVSQSPSLPVSQSPSLMLSLSSSSPFSADDGEGR